MLIQWSLYTSNQMISWQLLCLSYLLFISHIKLHMILCDKLKQEKFIPGLSNDLLNTLFLSWKWNCHIAALFRMRRVKKILLVNIASKNTWLNKFNKKRDCLRSTFTVINGLYLMGCLAYKELLKIKRLIIGINVLILILHECSKSILPKRNSQ